MLSNEIDPTSLRVYDQKNNILNPFTIEDFNEALAALKVEAEKKALANGLLKETRGNAEVMISGFFKGGFDGYVIEYK